MGTYSASLRAVGDTNSLPATVHLEDGQLSIAAGSHEIGSWSLADIELEPLPNGYRMAAEGDQIIIELKELDAFTEALSNGRFKRRLKLRGKEKKTAEAGESDAKPKQARTPLVGTRTSRPSTTEAPATKADPKPAKPATPRKPSEGGLLTRGMESLDHGISQAQKRFGPYLPDWMFSRAMVFILLMILVVMVIFPATLLIIGGLTIAFGAVAYSDPMIASRWLPGRTQPPQVLIAGVAILLLGVLVGIVRG